MLKKERCLGYGEIINLGLNHHGALIGLCVRPGSSVIIPNSPCSLLQAFTSRRRLKKIIILYFFHIRFITVSSAFSLPHGIGKRPFTPKPHTCIIIITKQTDDGMNSCSLLLLSYRKNTRYVTTHSRMSDCVIGL